MTQDNFANPMKRDENESEEGIEADTYLQITQLCQEGDRYVEHKQFSQAINKYCDALDLVPEPYENYKASTWILTAIGETYFLKGDYGKALPPLQDVMYCPEAIGNPYIHLRLGQVQFELGNLDRANDELARAYIGGGKEIFEGDDPKYYEHLKTILRDVE